MGAGNKVVILTVNPSYRESAYIINEKSGHWEPDGIWYSNWDHLGYTASRWTPKTTQPTYWSDRFGDTLCPSCWKQDEINWTAFICTRCNWCLDCEDDLDDCSCTLIYPPDKREDDAEYVAWWEKDEDDDPMS